ncbi:protein dispatched homolog 1-like [Strongylocentrotus purpuratus]|uniref:SSD domain-containing protein n=1 Tax=Strongylocentrotus purpuratus TaxID=7668 RepID=A0A7M7PP78_STRPU|nr:protein dispatched homolog 1-like [Strongylocentrotus purpuratus]
MLLNRYSIIVILLIVAVVTACTVVAALFFETPDFSDPIAGFEPRGTTISERSIAWSNMMNQTGAGLPLSTHPVKLGGRPPAEVVKEPPGIPHPGLTRPPSPSVASDQNQSQSADEESTLSYDDEEKGVLDGGELSWNEGGNLAPSTATIGPLCGTPKKLYARMVFEPLQGENLFNAEALHSMCRLELQTIRSHVQFMKACYTSNVTNACCPSWSLPNYVALLNNKSNCFNITNADVRATLQLLRTCSHFYRTRELRHDCSHGGASLSNSCANVPGKCTRFDAVYHILHYLVDVDFMCVERPNNERVTYALSVLPVYAGNDVRAIYDDEFKAGDVRDQTTKISGLYFGIKQDLFSEYLTTDAIYPCLGVVFVVLLMWMYIGSLFVTVMTVLSMGMSLICAYFVYFAVFRIPFFPFMNLTSVILLVGIGADDAFVFCDIWKQSRKDRPNAPRVIVVMETLRHAALSMFVTSLTTASAFYANTISNITAIKCFGLYAGTAILLHFVLSITWLPAAVVIEDIYFKDLTDCSSQKHEKKFKTQKSFFNHLVDIYRRCTEWFSDWARVFFQKILPCVVIKPRLLWLLLLGIVMLGGFCLIFLDPRLQLPTLPEFQLFRSMHPFERYDFVFKDLFWFEKVNRGSLYAHLPITVVWGVEPIDSGNPLDPDDIGNLVLNPDFDMASPKSQLWLLRFCKLLRNQTFFSSTPSLKIENCFIETFSEWMDSRSCIDVGTGMNNAPCCKGSRFPYSRSVFNQCLQTAVTELHQFSPSYFDKWKPGPRFGSQDNAVKAVIIEFDSSYAFSHSYEEMKEFWTKLESWMKPVLKTAPPGLGEGWFISYLDFYNLQDNLARGTPLSLGLSIIIAMVVMFLTTQNFVISLFAILSISGTICVTIGALVLLGWQLNILESVILSVSVGLSIDFTVHYGVAYRIAPEPDRESRVVYSLAHMGSAISMAALTTFVAGALMMPASILSYTQMGTFLMLIMIISWLYSTLFFQSLCRVIGPEGNVGQIPVPSCICYCLDRICCCCCCCCCCFSAHFKYANSCGNVGVEESEVSMSFHSSTLQSGESHELEPLNVENSSTALESGYCSHMSTNRGSSYCRSDFSPRREPLANMAERYALCSPGRSAAFHKTIPTTSNTSINGFSPAHKPPSPAHGPTLVSSKPPSPLISTQVVLEGSDFVTRVCHPSPKTESIEPIEPEEAIVPNRSSQVEDVWLPR